MILYHGSNIKFDKFTQRNKRITDDLYGGGIGYFTTGQKIAINYAKTRVSAYGGSEYLYKVDINLKKVFDVDAVFSGDKLLQILKHQKDIEAFARGASLLKYGDDKYTTMNKLQTGRIELTGNQVWKGLSYGGVRTSVAQQVLKDAGYDGLRYNGGVLTTDSHSHDVYIPYFENSIKIIGTYKVQRASKIITPKDHPVDKQGIVKEDIVPISEIQPAMNIHREDLPQIDDPKDICRQLEIDGSPITLPIKSLIPIQKEYDYDKIKTIAKTPNTKPIVISKDNYIIDGHHRWVASYMNKAENVKCYQIDLNVLDLLSHIKRHRVRKITEFAINKYNTNKFKVL